MMRLFSFCVASFFALSAGAQPWSLNQCIDYALANNLSVAYYEVSSQLREVALNSARMSLLPVVSGSVNQSFGFGRALTYNNTYEHRNTSNTSFSVGASAVLFQGFYKKNSIELSELNIDIAHEEKRKIENDLLVSVVSAYLKVLLADEIKQMKIAHLELSRNQYALICKQNEIGRRSAVDVVSARAVVVNDSVAWLSAENDYQLCRIELAHLLELPHDSISIDSPNGELEFNVVDNPDFIFDIAQHSRPEIKSAELRVASAQKQVDLVRSSYFPILRLNAGVSSNYYKTDGWSNASFPEQIRNNFSQSVSLSLNIPIFNAFSTRNSVRSAELQRKQTEIQFCLEKNNLRKVVEQAVYNVWAARSNYEGCLRSHEASLSAYNMVRAKFEKGNTSRIELDDARYEWMRAQSSLVVAKYELLMKVKLLDFYKNGR